MEELVAVLGALIEAFVIVVQAIIDALAAVI